MAWIRVIFLPVLMTTSSSGILGVVRFDVLSKTRVFFVFFFNVNRYLQAKKLLEIIVLYNFVLFMILGVCVKTVTRVTQ